MATTKYGYDAGVDYSELIQKDLAAQDYRSAAIHEAQRNEKIQGEGAGGQYPTTSHFADYLPKTDQVNQGLTQLQSGGAFDYDYKTDPVWQSYRKQYLREADRQTRDTMAAYAGQTGGMPSTAAVTAAQQAGNYQRSQLTDKIPELYNAAYSRWLQGQENERANLNLLHGIDTDRANQSLTQQQWLWQQQQAEQERSDRLQQQALQNAMNRWAVLGQADEKVASVLGVAVGTPTTDASYQQWQQRMQEQQTTWQQQMAEREMANTEAQQALQNQQNERSDAYDLVMKLVSMGLMPDDALIQAAGMAAYRASIQQMANKQAQLIAAGGAGGAGGSGGSRSRYTGKTQKEEEPAVYTPPATEGNTSLNGELVIRESLQQGSDGVTPQGVETMFDLGKKYGFYGAGKLSTYGQGVWNSLQAARQYNNGNNLAHTNPALWLLQQYADVPSAVSNSDILILKAKMKDKGWI